jgi:hypothetical protein
MTNGSLPMTQASTRTSLPCARWEQKEMSSGDCPTAPGQGRWRGSPLLWLGTAGVLFFLVPIVGTPAHGDQGLPEPRQQ